MTASSKPATQKMCLMREQSQQPQHRDDLELQLLRLVRHPFGQRVQAKEQQSDGKHGQDQKDGHDHHEGVGLTWRRNEWRKVVGGRRVYGCTQTTDSGVACPKS